MVAEKRFLIFSYNFSISHPAKIHIAVPGAEIQLPSHESADIGTVYL